MNKGHWTRELPTADGFYWYREKDEEHEENVVIWWEQNMQWMYFAGNEIPLGNDMTHKITGEFWSVPLSPPTDETP